ncbi:hypothetical protein F5X97DRAFT_298063 [Nemania serpens]|nr:hypothetical protein F5X97DRAFT_298063 [Nemania serpens]
MLLLKMAVKMLLGLLWINAQPKSKQRQSGTGPRSISLLVTEKASWRLFSWIKAQIAWLRLQQDTHLCIFLVSMGTTNWQ